MVISFLNDVDKQLILELKNSIEKYHPVFPNKSYFFWTPCIVEYIKEQAFKIFSDKYSFNKIYNLDENSF